MERELRVLAAIFLVALIAVPALALWGLGRAVDSRLRRREQEDGGDAAREPGTDDPDGGAGG